MTFFRSTRKAFVLLPLLLALPSIACKPRGQVNAEVESYTPAEATAKFGLHLIPEVLAMKRDGDVLPTSVYTQYDTRTIGESMVFRLHRLMEDAVVPGGSIPINWMPDSQIAMFFRNSDMESIASLGFLNQFQTGKAGGGAFNPAVRQQTEDYLAAAQIGTGAKPYELRPKYGMLSIKTAKNLGSKTATGLSNYGDWIAVFKPSVELRTSVTNRDSLNGYINALPAFGSEVFRCSPGDYSCRRKYQDTMYGDTVHPTVGEYFEAQVWGALDLSDVDYFLVPANVDGTRYQYLTTLGIPIRRYSLAQSFNRQWIEEDVVFFAGNAAQMAQYEKRLAASRIFGPALVAVAGEDDPKDAGAKPTPKSMFGTFVGKDAKGGTRRIDLYANRAMSYSGSIMPNAVAGTWDFTDATPSRIHITLTDGRSFWYRISKYNSICFAGAATFDINAVGSCLKRQ